MKTESIRALIDKVIKVKSYKDTNKERRAVTCTEMYAHRAALIISGDINSIRVLRFIDRRALFLSDGHFYTP